MEGQACAIPCGAAGASLVLHLWIAVGLSTATQLNARMRKMKRSRKLMKLIEILRRHQWAR